MIDLSFLRQFVQFALSGMIGVVLYYIILHTFTEWFGVWYMASALTATFVNWSCNFFIQRWYTFGNKTRERMKEQAGLYILMAVALGVANMKLLNELVENHGLYYLHAQLIVTVIITAASYVLSRVIFSDRRLVARRTSLPEQDHNRWDFD